MCLYFVHFEAHLLHCMTSLNVFFHNWYDKKSYRFETAQGGNKWKQISFFGWTVSLSFNRSLRQGQKRALWLMKVMVTRARHLRDVLIKKESLTAWLRPDRYRDVWNKTTLCLCFYTRINSLHFLAGIFYWMYLPESIIQHETFTSHFYFHDVTDSEVKQTEVKIR